MNERGLCRCSRRRRRAAEGRAAEGRAARGEGSALCTFTRGRNTQCAAGRTEGEPPGGSSSSYLFRYDFERDEVKAPAPPPFVDLSGVVGRADGRTRDAKRNGRERERVRRSVTTASPSPAYGGRPLQLGRFACIGHHLPFRKSQSPLALACGSDPSQRVTTVPRAGHSRLLFSQPGFEQPTMPLFTLLRLLRAGWRKKETPISPILRLKSTASVGYTNTRAKDTEQRRPRLITISRHTAWLSSPLGMADAVASQPQDGGRHAHGMIKKVVVPLKKAPCPRPGWPLLFAHDTK